MKEQPNRQPKSKKKACFVLFLNYILTLSLWGFFITVIIFVYYSIGLPSVRTLSETDKVIKNLEVQYSNKELIRKYGNVSDNKLVYSEIPIHLIEALTATEDRKFFEHHGIDIHGIMRAMYVNTKAGRIKQGGSTITQQLAKMMFLSRERTLKRKIQEAILAVQIELLYTKEQILTFYLNKAYFGAGKYGIVNASRFYFEKEISQLTLEESAMLVGLLKAPSKYSPVNNPELAKQRANQIIANMANVGYLSEDEAVIMLADDMEYIYASSFNKKNQSYYFADWIKNQIHEYVDENENNISVITTLDYKTQSIAEEVIYNFVEAHKEQLGQSQIALIAISKDGEILAMSGGKNYDKSPFNRSIYAYRQAGSSFKLFVYLTALEKGINPQDLFIDEPIAVGDWYPENYKQKYYGEVTMSEAFAKSLNSVAVQIAEICGIKNVAKTAQKLGISSEMDIHDPTIALGSVGVNLLELTSAYASMANEGYPVIPYYIKKIKSEDGKILYQRKSSSLNRVINKKNVKKMREMLYMVIEDGTGRNANIKKFSEENFGGFFRGNKYSIGGKTGTSQDYQDAWFIGYADDLIVGVWMGNDDNTPTNNIVGGSLPAGLWRNFVENVAD